MGEAAYYTKHRGDLERNFFKAIPGNILHLQVRYQLNLKVGITIVRL